MATTGLREKAFDAYKALIERGIDISIIAFARDAERYIGEPVAVLTIQEWAMEDRWADIIVHISFDVTPELHDKKILFDKAFDETLHAITPSDKAAMARAFYNIAKSIPAPVRHKVEQQLIDVRADIFTYLDCVKDIPKPKKASLYKTWIDLESLLMPELIVCAEDDGIEADQLIMEARRAKSNPATG